MGKKKLPGGWVYVGKTLLDNIKEGGILNHFYHYPETNSIYQVVGLNAKLLTYQSILGTHRENKLSVRAKNVFGSLKEMEIWDLEDITSDKEVVKTKSKN